MINTEALTSPILLCLKHYRAASEIVTHVWRVINQLCVPGVAVLIRRIALVGYVYVSPFPLRFGARCLHENGPQSLGVRIGE